MPTYLCHGFRWKRESIIYFTLFNGLEDVSPDWTIRPACSEALLDTILYLHPYVPGGVGADESQQNETLTASADEPAASETEPEEDDDVSEAGTETEEEMGEPALRFLEEYSLEDEASWAPSAHAYVADYVVNVDLSVDIAHEMEHYEARNREGGGKWFERLRNELQGVGDAPIRWYIVVCDDEERAFDEPEAEGQGVQEEEREETVASEASAGKKEAQSVTTVAAGPRPGGNLVGQKAAEPKKGLRSGLKGILPLGRRRKE